VLEFVIAWIEYLVCELFVGGGERGAVSALSVGSNDGSEGLGS
jgi:hypothetical protein